MRFEFKDKKLRALYYEERNAHRFHAVDDFFDVMTQITAARDVRDLYEATGLHFEKLKGPRKDEHSLRLNVQWRLTLWVEQDEQGEFLLINRIEDYH